MGIKNKEQSRDSKMRQAEIKKLVNPTETDLSAGFPNDSEEPTIIPVVELEATDYKESTNSATEPETALFAGLSDSPEPDTTNSVTPVKTPAVTPKKKGRPPVTRETKKRYAITMLPSLYAKASEKAAEQGRSLSEVIGRYIEQYVKED